MRVLWLAPWFRSQANIYGRGLTLEGHEVCVVTTSKHSEQASSLVPEIVCPSKPYDPRWLPTIYKAERLFRRLQPDVVIADEVTDPLFALVVLRMRPKWLVIHDALPHDQTHEPNRWRRAILRAGRRSSNQILTFSEHVATEIEGSEWNQGSRVYRAKLLSDLLDEDVPSFRTSDERRDFVLMGRIAPYKNVDHVLRAWVQHVKGPCYRGDRLVIWGKGEWDWSDDLGVSPQDAAVEWRSESYRYADIRDGRFSGFKGSLCVYSEASQSAVQILSAQLGVLPIVSNVGAMPEYQAPTLPMLDPTDLQGLVNVLDQVADPDRAVELGRIAQDYYMSNHSEKVVSKGLAMTLDQSVEQRGG